MYSEEQLVGIAKREKNTKRSYLVVNRLQGKHVPVCPEEALAMFSELADLVKEAYGKERLLLVGFAETATAIGAALAIELNTLYIQTTREEVAGAEYLYFTESHSHATEQRLVKDDLDRVMKQIDRVVFVEDEVTTGNTILKIVDILEERYPGRTFAVASLLNGMDEKALDVYREREISVRYLVKTDHSRYGEIAGGYRGDGIYRKADTGGRKYSAKTGRQAWETKEESSKSCCGKYREIKAGGWMNARRCIKAEEYRKACEKLWKTIEEKKIFVDKQRILVLGTEEFMYPALYVADKIEKSRREKGLAAEVRFHATTRSPIMVSSEEEYPLHVRYELRSLYEDGRRTFVYDLKKYDLALILTDAAKGSGTGTDMLVDALRSCGNETICLVRWCGE